MSFAFPARPETRAQAPSISDLTSMQGSGRESSFRSPFSEDQPQVERSSNLITSEGTHGLSGPSLAPRAEFDVTHPLPFGQASTEQLQLPRRGESALTGEPIGPRIWTGRGFLPRFVGERIMPGEGPCYFYDDSSHCRTVIDGELVNPHWGVTKAGRPRKRLAVACLTCREKKIKCDPDYPKCVQCVKFGRHCKFKNA